MTLETVTIPAGHYACAIPPELVTGGITLCAGVQFRQLNGDQCELVLLTEADVERLTSPEPSA